MAIAGGVSYKRDRTPIAAVTGRVTATRHAAAIGPWANIEPMPLTLVMSMQTVAIATNAALVGTTRDATPGRGRSDTRAREQAPNAAVTSCGDVDDRGYGERAPPRAGHHDYEPSRDGRLVCLSVRPGAFSNRQERFAAQALPGAVAHWLRCNLRESNRSVPACVSSSPAALVFSARR